MTADSQMLPATGALPDADPSSVLVWDRPTRVFHWALVAVVFTALFTGEAEGVLFMLHLWAGYAVLGLLVFRLIWGAIGTEHARFADFVHPWRVVKAHVAEVLGGMPHRAVGHNPLGGWMVVALLAVLALLVATGLFAGDDDQSGPFARQAGPWLADALGEVHEGLQGLLWVMIGVHVAGVLLESMLTGENLIRAMWTGRKRDPEAFAATVADIRPVAAWRLVLAVAVAAASVYGVAVA